MTRRVSIQTTLGEQLQFRQLIGREALSEVFSFEVDLLSASKSIDVKSLLGTSATIEVELDGGGKRYLNGLITRMGMAGQDLKNYAYRARIDAWLWLGTRKSDFKIFQNKTVPEIIEEVLGKYGFPLEKRLSGSYRTWDYCCQYAETDHNFVSRLMEHEGIYYYFKHSAGQHVLVLADDIIGSHNPLSGGATIPFYPPDKLAVADKECFDAWELMQEIKSGGMYNKDYDFEKPKANLTNQRQLPAGHAHDSYEIYEWPGGYTQVGDGENYVRVRVEENLTGQSKVIGHANHRALAPGFTFTLENYPRADQNQQYLLTSVEYHFRENPQVSDDGGEVGSTQRFKIHAQPTSLAYRPAVVTPKPRSQGPQTAVVVGPAGEEIWTDKYGRVKVQFNWDRIGTNDDHSSCWIRVSHPWAGLNYGSIHIPRIGQEVIVDHIGGDLDLPIITGRVYNAIQMPPWKLPDNKTQSGTLTNWSKGGGGASMLRFEDKKGVEHLELSNTYGNTYLNMGYLMHQGSGTQRGYGFELRTNLWGSIRADKGLLITTYTQDHTKKVANDNPDGFDDLGAGLSHTDQMVQQAQAAISGAKDLVGALRDGRAEKLMALVPSLGAALSGLAGGGAAAASAAIGAVSSLVAAAPAAEAGAETGTPGNGDPAMPESRELQALSKQIDKPIVSIVSPEGHSMISPKPIVVSSGQSTSLHAKQHITLSSGAQLTQLAKGGMFTHVDKGGQVTVVSNGDTVHTTATGALNMVSKNNASITSTKGDAHIEGFTKVLVKSDTEGVLITAPKRIKLECGQVVIELDGEKGTIVMTAPNLIFTKSKKTNMVSDEKFQSEGVEGVLQFSGELNQFGTNINLNPDKS